MPLFHLFPQKIKKNEKKHLHFSRTVIYYVIFNMEDVSR